MHQPNLHFALYHLYIGKKLLPSEIIFVLIKIAIANELIKAAPILPIFFIDVITSPIEI